MTPRSILNYLRTPAGLIIIMALFLTAFDNQALFKALAKLHSSTSFLIAFGIGLTAAFVVLLTIFSSKYVFKPFAAFILVSAAAASFFMDHYGAIIEHTMIQTVLETDRSEVLELLSFSLAMHVILKGALPAVLIYKIRIRHQSLKTELRNHLILLAMAAIVLGGAISSHYKDFSFIARNGKCLRYFVNPAYPIYASGQCLKHRLSTESSTQAKAQNWQDVSKKIKSMLEPITPMATDAKRLPSVHRQGKKSLVIIVVGESARAMNFSLNGYARNTNPQLSKASVISFSNTYSCGVLTGVSVPCMFSAFGQKDYKDEHKWRHENLLDILSRVGINVLWRDNNSGCKTVCARVKTEATSRMTTPELCNSEECYDEAMLHKLQGSVDETSNDAVIVLHQKGSHGTAHHKRSPEAFKQFGPECKRNTPSECPRDEVLNAYDNTLLYTDHFLAEAIQFLKRNSDQYNTALLYMSDHGESLGENGVYAHGGPYDMAPDEQTHIPFILWMSNGFAKDTGIDLKCLHSQRGARYSHDNLFHSVLGLLDINTTQYDIKLDIFASCRRQNQSK